MPEIDPEVGRSERPEQEPLRSVHTSNLPEILEQFGISLLVSTYQAGRLVVLRSQGGVLNTHFRSFDKPMGLAVTSNRLAVGSAHSIWEFHNLPAVCSKLNRPSDTGAGEDRAGENRPGDNANPRGADGGPDVSTEGSGVHDACFLPRTTHWTGDIQIHEMGWTGEAADEDLLFVNTRFSCLCRRSDVYNFEPVWRPRFVKSYVPSDCCHLNGLGLKNGRASVVTALGASGEPAGWRKNKRDGGIVVDVDSDELICSGLSMPHSPRWYRDRWWLCESGQGGFGYLDPRTGRYESVCKLAGFTRGLSFAGPLAFIGLSQVRESAVFGGVPIAERELEERACGVWVVHIETGAIVAFLRFEDAVQEIFAVEAVAWRYPEIVNEDRELLAGSFELPDDALKDVPDDLRRDC